MKITITSCESRVLRGQCEHVVKFKDDLPELSPSFFLPEAYSDFFFPAVSPFFSIFAHCSYTNVQQKPQLKTNPTLSKIGMR